MRIFILSGAVGFGLFLVIVLLAFIFDFRMPSDLDPTRSFAAKHHGLICHKEREVGLEFRKSCIYNCEDGSKARIDVFDKCLKEIEL